MGYFKHFLVSEIFNDEFKFRGDPCDAIFLQISFDVFQINSEDQYEVFESSQAWISALTPNSPTTFLVVSLNLSRQMLV